MSNTVSKSGIYFFIVHANPKTFTPSFFTNMFTGSSAFHSGFVDLNKSELIDMNTTVRVLSWPRWPQPKYEMHLYPADLIERSDLDMLIKQNEKEGYGYLDYIGFGLRWLYNLFGLNISDFKGTICSEMVSEWANACGYNFPVKPVLSPGGLERHIVEVLKLPRFL